MSKVAIVQQTPAFLDRERALQKTVAAIYQAANSGAKLISFPEAFISGYPAWVWRLRPGTDREILTSLLAPGEN